MMKWKHKDLLDISTLEAQEITKILDTAAPMKEILSRPIRKLPTLRGKSVLLLF
jgi:aspartate carbamoyltransferase catalytic subunit